MTITVRKPTPGEITDMENLPVWECRPSTFNWYYDSAETSLISEGDATVDYDGGSVTFGAGDLVMFPKGLKCVWTIRQTIKKHYQLK